MSKIRLVVTDNEGCFIPAKGRPIDPRPLARLQDFLRSTPSAALTFCTGRSVPYMEAMGQLAGLVSSPVPFICEGGTVLYWPAEDRAEPLVPAPDFTSLTHVLTPGTFRIEPGKFVCLSFYPEPPETVPSLHEKLLPHIDAARFSALTSVAAVDVTPVGFDKGFGLRQLEKRTGISCEEMLYVGDANNDLPAFTVAGATACPSNASDEVKRLAGYVSPYPATEGLLDILRRTFAPVDAANPLPTTVSSAAAGSRGVPAASEDVDSGSPGLRDQHGKLIPGATFRRACGAFDVWAYLRPSPPPAVWRFGRKGGMAEQVLAESVGSVDEVLDLAEDLARHELARIEAMAPYYVECTGKGHGRDPYHECGYRGVPNELYKVWRPDLPRR